MERDSTEMTQFVITKENMKTNGSYGWQGAERVSSILSPLEKP